MNPENVTIRSEVQIPQITVAVPGQSSTVELRGQDQPREGEEIREGVVFFDGEEYCLATDSGEVLVLNPQSDGPRLDGRRIRITGTISKR